MNVRIYLGKKYGGFSAITAVEARVFGIPYPLKNKWLDKYGDIKVTENMASQLLWYMRCKGPKFDKAKEILLSAGFKMPTAKVPIIKRKEIKLQQIKQDAKLSNNDLSEKWQRGKVDPVSDSFLSSYEWRRIRMEVLKKYGARCQCCGATAKDGVVIHVDHIKPRRLFPQLALDINNLQVLCEVCNHGKGNWDMTDWRVELRDVSFVVK